MGKNDFQLADILVKVYVVFDECSYEYVQSMVRIYSMSTLDSRMIVRVFASGENNTPMTGVIYFMSHFSN